MVNALISASKADIALDLKKACAIDLAGRDVFEAVQMSVNPKAITTPWAYSGFVDKLTTHFGWP